MECSCEGVLRESEKAIAEVKSVMEKDCWLKIDS